MVSVSDYFDALCDEEKVKFKEETLFNICNLRAYCESLLTDIYAIPSKDLLVSAILNSVDWGELYHDLFEECHIEGESDNESEEKSETSESD